MNEQLIHRRIKNVLNRIVRSDMSKDLTDGFTFLRHRHIENAVELAYKVPIGLSYVDVEKNIDALYASVGAPVEVIDFAGVVVIRIITKPLPKTVSFNPDDLTNQLLIGYNMSMVPTYHPLNTHLLVGGASKAGKTDALRFYIYQLLLQGYEVRICDLKGFSFFPFEGLVKIAKDIQESRDLLVASIDEMNYRKQLVFNARSREVIKTFKPIVIVIDEGASLAPKQHSGNMRKIAQECDECISLFGQQGREPKMFMIYATQRPDMDVINKQFKANVEASIAFRTKDEINSRIILSRGGAEKISPDTPGRCIYAYDRDHLLQVPFIGGDKEWSNLLLPLKTEVINDGKSQRKHHDRLILDTDSHNFTDSNDEQQSRSEKESEQGTTTTVQREVSQLRLAQGKSMESHTQRKEVNERHLPSPTKRTYADDF